MMDINITNSRKDIYEVMDKKVKKEIIKRKNAPKEDFVDEEEFYKNLKEA